MTRELVSQVEIDAPPEAVWQVLTDFEAFPSWNPFIVRVQAADDLAPGSTLGLTVAPPRLRRVRLRAKVLKADPFRELIWLDHVFVIGVLDGVHRFEIVPLGSGRTLFTQSGSFSGVMLPLLERPLAQAEHGFDEMNLALQRRAERGDFGAAA